MKEEIAYCEKYSTILWKKIHNGNETLTFQTGSWGPDFIYRSHESETRCCDEHAGCQYAVVPAGVLILIHSKTAPWALSWLQTFIVRCSTLDVRCSTFIFIKNLPQPSGGLTAVTWICAYFSQTTDLFEPPERQEKLGTGFNTGFLVIETWNRDAQQPDLFPTCFGFGK